MSMQNYAKFSSNVVSDSMEQISSRGYSNGYYGDSIFSDFFDIIKFLLQILAGIIGVIGFMFVIFFFFYIVISLFTKGGEKTLLDIKNVGEFLMKFINKIYTGTINLFKIIFNFLKNKKLLSLFIIVLYFGFIFSSSVIDGKSRYLKLEKIQTGYVGVDLGNNKILQSGYHLYSPIYTSIFLSPTQDFNFEIAEVTANTSEELAVTFDYRVGFKLINDKRLNFYNKFGAKNIKLVSSDIVMPKILEVIKGTIRNYGFKDISLKRDEIKNTILTESNILLNQLGVNLQDITLIDIRLPKSYLVSKEELLKSENELKLAEAKFEAQKKESEKKLLEAQNLKKVKIIEAEAIAEYNKIIKSESITSNMLEMKKIENQTLKINKWDGKLPTTVGDQLDL